MIKNLVCHTIYIDYHFSFFRIFLTLYFILRRGEGGGGTYICLRKFLFTQNLKYLNSKAYLYQGSTNLITSLLVKIFILVNLRHLSIH